MKLKAVYTHLKPYLNLLGLYMLTVVLRSQSSDGSMTQFYIVIIVFGAIILAALISFLFTQKKNRKD